MRFLASVSSVILVGSSVGAVIRSVLRDVCVARCSSKSFITSLRNMPSLEAGLVLGAAFKTLFVGGVVVVVRMDVVGFSRLCVSTCSIGRLIHFWS